MPESGSQPAQRANTSSLPEGQTREVRARGSDRAAAQRPAAGQSWPTTLPESADSRSVAQAEIKHDKSHQHNVRLQGSGQSRLQPGAKVAAPAVGAAALGRAAGRPRATPVFIAELREECQKQEGVQRPCRRLHHGESRTGPFLRHERAHLIGTMPTKERTTRGMTCCTCTWPAGSPRVGPSAPPPGMHVACCTAPMPFAESITTPPQRSVLMQ